MADPKAEGVSVEEKSDEPTLGSNFNELVNEAQAMGNVPRLGDEEAQQESSGATAQTTEEHKTKSKAS